MKTVKFLRYNTFIKQNIFLFQKFCTHQKENVLTISYCDGLPHFIVPLPSRQEDCLFILKPIGQNVGDLMNSIKVEDLGIDRIAIYTPDGKRISKSNSIFSLLSHDFNLVINESTYHVPASQPVISSEEKAERLNEIKNMISQLCVTVNVDEFNLEKEQELKMKLEKIQTELNPMETLRIDIASKAATHTRRLTWLGLGAMGLQFGLLARLTWWEYSWDIMEPVTYFVGYGTAIAMYAYYVVTRQEYCFPQVFDREYLKQFYLVSSKNKFDIDRYNELRESQAEVQNDLKRLRDPLLLNLPLQQKSLN